MLSNLVSFALDEVLQAAADREAMVYTRYSDDIIFSTNSDFTRSDAQKLLSEVERIFCSFGFALHRRKVTIAPPGSRKIALGLLVDGSKLKHPREYRDRLSDHIRGVEKFGVAHHAQEWHFASLWGLIRHIQGLLVYARSVDPGFAAPLETRFRAALTAQGWPEREPKPSVE